jgi:hypothetical protein
MIAANVSCNDSSGGKDADWVDDLISQAIDARVDEYADAWLGGQWDQQLGGKGLASILSAQLCDCPGNKFRDVLAVVQRAALGGDDAAGELIMWLALEHANAAYEARELEIFVEQA